MKELLIGLCLAGVSGCCWMAWNHPKAYSKIAPWLGCLGLAVFVFGSGLGFGFDAAIEKLRPDLTAVQIAKAEAAMATFEVRIAWINLGGVVAAFFFWTLILLELLPRGRD